jgi:WD40 repeat protein
MKLPNGNELKWDGQELSVFDAASGKCLVVVHGHIDRVGGAAVFSDGRFLSWSDDCTLRIWGTEGQPLAVLEGHTSWVRGAAALCDGRILSWAGRDLRIWGAEGMALAVLKGHTGDIVDVLVLPDGRVASWSIDGSVRVWSLDSGSGSITLPAHSSPVIGVEVETAETLIVSYSDGTTVRWNWVSGASKRI